MSNMTKEKAELVTFICKKAKEYGLTYNDLLDIAEAVEEFYFDNARP